MGQVMLVLHPHGSWWTYGHYRSTHPARSLVTQCHQFQVSTVPGVNSAKYPPCQLSTVPSVNSAKGPPCQLSIVPSVNSTSVHRAEYQQCECPPCIVSTVPSVNSAKCTVFQVFIVWKLSAECRGLSVHSTGSRVLNAEC